MKFNKRDLKILVVECIVEMQENQHIQSKLSDENDHSEQDSDDMLWSSIIDDLSMPTTRLVDAVADQLRDNPETLQAILMSLGEPGNDESMKDDVKREIRKDIMDKFKQISGKDDQ